MYCRNHQLTTKKKRRKKALCFFSPICLSVSLSQVYVHQQLRRDTNSHPFLLSSLFFLTPKHGPVAFSLLHFSLLSSLTKSFTAVHLPERNRCCFFFFFTEVASLLEIEHEEKKRKSEGVCLFPPALSVYIQESFFITHSQPPRCLYKYRRHCCLSFFLSLKKSDIRHFS